MRDYGKVAPSFWIGATGKALRGDANAQLLALYLMTSPHSNMIGVFHCPVLYMAHETGITLEGASEALRRLVEVGFCTYEGESETVFVHRMAAYQVGESLSPKDNQVKGIQKDFEKMAPELIKQAFYAIYSVAFHLPDLQNTQGQAQAPCKPGTGTGTGTGYCRAFCEVATRHGTAERLGASWRLENMGRGCTA